MRLSNMDAQHAEMMDQSREVNFCEPENIPDNFLDLVNDYIQRFIFWKKSRRFK